MAQAASYELPAGAVSTLAEPGLELELHSISFSHYCIRAQWALRLCGLPFKEVGYLPAAHVPGIKGLQKRFKQGPCKPTASSKSPVATPVLAIYSPTGQPLSLIYDSEAICRYAALRAKALGLPAANQLYGDSLTITPASSAAPGNSSNSSVCSTVAGSGGLYTSVAELEQRLSGAMGIEVRRILYHHMLPHSRLAGMLFWRNSSGWERLFAWPLYLVCSWLLPKALNINAHTAARAQQRLLEEFDFFDQLLLQQQQQQQAGQAGAAQPDLSGPGAEGPEGPGGVGQPQAGAAASGERLPYYLCGPQLTAADVSLACLGGYIVGVPAEHLGTVWAPGIDSMPKELGAFMQALRDRPTGKYILDMCRVHGPVAHKDRGPMD